MIAAVSLDATAINGEAAPLQCAAHTTANAAADTRTAPMQIDIYRIRGVRFYHPSVQG